MRKILVILLAAAALTAAAAWAAGGDSGASLISKSYLAESYLPALEAQLTQRLEEKTQPAYEAALASLAQTHSTYLALAGGGSSYASQLTDLRLKKGDILTLSAGSGGMALAGSVDLSWTGAAVVDVTAGQTASAGPAALRHRYLAAENTSALLTVTSDTAVVSVEGRYTLVQGSGVDYNAMAELLAGLGLFQGTGTGYGSGYDLELSSTRIMGVVMFLRLIGEEEAALQSTAPNPFLDTPAWCDRYVAYAYEKGYTNGVGVSAAGERYFAPDRTISSEEYVTLLLRALGYADSGDAPDFTWDTAVSTAVSLGVFTAGEQTMLGQSAFLRAQMVYLSCYALQAGTKTGGQLLDRTAASGAASREALLQAVEALAPLRLAA